MTDLISNLTGFGLSEKAAKIYLSTLEIGEASVQEIAKRSRIKRTTVYDVLGELETFGALVKTKRGKKHYYLAEDPRRLLKRARERLLEFEEALPALEERKHTIYPRPRVVYLYGPAGFKQAWDFIFSSAEKEFLITTPAESFLSFATEKYILEEIIATKKKLGLRSRQLVTDSPYARKIAAKDFAENRISKFLPSRYPISFSEIVCGDSVIFISPRADNFICVLESEAFAKTRRNMFEILWSVLP